MQKNLLLVLILVIQVLCTVFFVSDIAITVLGLRSHPISWQTREYLELGAAVGLVLGVLLGAIALWSSFRRARRAENRLRVAQGAFADLMEERFREWELTEAERDVAVFAIKGLSTAEIARLRNTSEGTVKAQTNAIYRKAGVTSRPQLLSLFIDDLMDGSLV